jgi:hypothetical protein
MLLVTLPQRSCLKFHFSCLVGQDRLNGVDSMNVRLYTCRNDAIVVFLGEKLRKVGQGLGEIRLEHCFAPEFMARQTSSNAALFDCFHFSPT